MKTITQTGWFSYLYVTYSLSRFNDLFQGDCLSTITVIGCVPITQKTSNMEQLLRIHISITHSYNNETSFCVTIAAAVVFCPIDD